MNDTSAASTIPPQIQPKKRKQMDKDDYIVKTGASQKQELDKLMAEFVFSTNLPFQAVDHPYFHTLVNALWPG